MDNEHPQPGSDDVHVETLVKRWLVLWVVAGATVAVCAISGMVWIFVWGVAK